MFNRHTYLKLSLVIVTLLSLNACSSTGTIDSRKADGYTVQPQRLFVRLALGHTVQIKGALLSSDHDEADNMGSAIVDALRNCGTLATYYKVDPLSVNNAEATALQQFAPDTVLDVVATAEGVSTQTFYNRGMMSSVDTHHVSYQLQLTDMRTRMIVWKGEIQLQQRWNAGSTLADLVLKQLQKDGIINAACNLSHQ